MIQTLRSLYNTVEQLHKNLEEKAVAYISNRDATKTLLGIRCYLQGISEAGEGIFEVVLETSEGSTQELVNIPSEELGEAQ